MMWARRATVAVVVVIASAVVVLLWAGRGYPTPYAESSADEAGISAQLNQVLYYASMAPSSHNAQMWQVRAITDNEVEILLDPQRLLPAVDPGNREAMISIGAFIENLSQAAATLGLATEVKVNDTAPASGAVARIQFAPGPQTGDEPLRLMETAYTDRFAYLPKSLSEADRSALLESASRAALFFPSQSAEGQFLANAHVEAVTQQGNDEAVQKELANWVRFSGKEAAEHRDGLTAAAMGLSRLKEKLFSLFVNRQNFTSRSSINQGIAMARDQVTNCAGFVVITGEDTPAGLIEAGRNLQRLWLTAAERRVAIQPISAQLEIGNLRARTQEQLGLAQSPQMILRVGYVGSYKGETNPRRPVSEFVTRPE